MTTAQGGSGIEGRSLLAVGTVIRGTVDAPGLVEIGGTLGGSVRAGTILVEVTGKIMGTLSAERITIRGRVEGEIMAADLRILSGAVVQGQVTVTTLAVEAGAGIDFACKMQGTGSSGEG